ncbi:MAG: DNA polymerase IV [Pseudonocardiales bacterium]|nr:MAG: DNA polymerase IV [Pseudonocardiales bacterium]
MGRSHAIPRAPSTGPLADDTGCPILHVDMDAFFASVEIRRHPELAGLPVIVGGSRTRGVVCSATYEARRYGVHSAMSTARAVRLCPPAVVLPTDHEAYSAASAEVMELLGEITPVVEPISMDEAFLDVSGARRLLGSSGEIARLIRSRVRRELRLPCSVGVAPTKFVAKVASARCKPDGMCVVPAGGVVDYLHPLPVTALWGVGPRTAEQLRCIGITTIADLAHSPAPRLVGAVGSAAGTHLHELAWGRDPRRVLPLAPEVSIGAEETLGTDLFDRAAIDRELLRLADRTAARLRAGGRRGRAVSLKVRFADFTTITRAHTMDAASDVGQQLYQVARDLYDRLDRTGSPARGGGVRLLGIRVEGIVGAGDLPEQLVLGDRSHGWRDADQAVDAVVSRFGSGAVAPAALLRAAAVPNSAPAPPPRTGPDAVR